MSIIQDKDGKTSLLRVLAIPVTIIGLLETLAGAVAVFVCLFKGFDMGGVIALLTTGMGLVTLAFGGKVLQKNAEVKTAITNITNKAVMK